MFKWFFMTLLFTYIAVTAGQFLSFSSDKTTFTKCIKDHISKKNYIKENVEEIAKLAVRRFLGKVLQKDVFDLRFKFLFNDLRCNKMSHSFSKDQLSDQFRDAIKQALKSCSIDDSKLTADPGRKNDYSKTIFATDQGNDWLFFNLNETMLSEYIENHLLSSDLQYEQDNFAKIISRLTAKRFSEKTILRQALAARLNRFFYDLRYKEGIQLSNHDKATRKLRTILQEALEDSAVRKDPRTIVFQEEPPEVAIVLDYILVKWSNDLGSMIQSRNGRALLRRFADDAQTALETALKSFQDNQLFRLSLRILWVCRAHLFFNGRDKKIPYIRHRCTFNDPKPHMRESNFNAIASRCNKNFKMRNPSVSQSSVDEILYIHSADRPNYSGEHDFFTGYNTCGMTSEEYYLESQIDQFYRVLFFFAELRAVGIKTNEDDIYDGSLPDSVISEKLQAIVYNDTSYRNYLLDKRSFYESVDGADSQNEIFLHLVGTSRVNEEDLMTMRMNLPSTSGVKSREQLSDTIPSTDTTNARTKSSTTQHKPSKRRKDEVWKNENGKCFSKRTKTNTSPDSSCNDDNPDTKNLNDFKNSLNCDDDFKQLQPLMEEASVFETTLREFFSVPHFC